MSRPEVEDRSLAASKAPSIEVMPAYAGVQFADLRKVMEEIIQECDGRLQCGSNPILNDGLKLKLAAELLRCVESGERDLDRLKQRAIEGLAMRAVEH
jgi:hypothetical protein